MNEEVKEILFQLEIVARKHTIKVLDDGNIETMPASVVDELRLNNYSAKILLNYITNLQKEKEKLKHELKSKPDNEITLETKDGQIMTIIQSERIDMQEKLNKSLNNAIEKYLDYKQRNEKAIEYIENHTENIDRGRYYEDYVETYDLLNILQGGDDND